MRRVNKKVALMAAATILAMTALTGCKSSLNNDEVIATVGKEEVPVGVANFYARMQQAQFETNYMGLMGEDMWSTEVSKDETYEESMKKDLKKNLEDMYLLKQNTAEYKVEITEDEAKKIDKAADAFIAENPLEDKEAVSANRKYVKQMLELFTIQRKMDEAMKQGVNEEVADEEAAQKSMQYVKFAYTVTDEAGESKDMTEKEKTALKKTAQEFLDKMKGAESTDLEAAAKEAGYTVEIVTFGAEGENPNADLVKAADALEEGQMTELVDTETGCYIAKVTSLLDREATDAKKAEIVDQRKQEQYDSILKKWRDATEITEDEKLWKKISFEDLGVTLKMEDEAPYSDGPAAEEAE